MKLGASKRATSSTKMNDKSSRSHSIFIITVTQKHLIELDTKSGKLFLVDLAGSEKVKKTGAEGNCLEEAKTINKSLSCLGNVINALTDGKSRFVPYRDSKLTRLLQDSLGGNSVTTLIINCSPSIYNSQETLSTLRFGTRAKSIKNKPRVNQIMCAFELMRQLEQSKKENAALLEELQMYRNKGHKRGASAGHEMLATKQELESLKGINPF
jgi:kinesin family protein 5